MNFFSLSFLIMIINDYLIIISSIIIALTSLSICKELS